MLKRIGYTAGGFVLIGVLAVAILWGLSVGTVQFSLSQILNIVIDQFSSPLAIDDPMNSPDQTIIWLLRMPRLLMAAIIGAGLAVSGVIMQAIVKNPLADPYILGISSGASLGATIAILFGVALCSVRTSSALWYLSGLWRFPSVYCLSRTWVADQIR